MKILMIHGLFSKNHFYEIKWFCFESLLSMRGTLQSQTDNLLDLHLTKPKVSSNLLQKKIRNIVLFVFY